MAARTRRDPDQGMLTPEQFLALYTQTLAERGPADAEALWEWRFHAIDYDAAKRRRRLAATLRSTDDIEEWLYNQRGACIRVYLAERAKALPSAPEQKEGGTHARPDHRPQRP